MNKTANKYTTPLMNQTDRDELNQHKETTANQHCSNNKELMTNKTKLVNDDNNNMIHDLTSSLTLFNPKKLSTIQPTAPTRKYNQYTQETTYKRF
jgi:hypothetical protein